MVVDFEVQVETENVVDVDVDGPELEELVEVLDELELEDVVVDDVDAVEDELVDEELEEELVVWLLFPFGEVNVM